MTPDGKKRQVDLHYAVKHWPTPKAQNASGAGIHGEGGLDLQTATKLWATPAAQDSKNATLPQSQAGRDSLPGDMLRTGVQGNLNPAFVEALMGFPIGWSDTSGL
jgi:hypothetical protein